MTTDNPAASHAAAPGAAAPTARQSEILEFIRTTLIDRGAPPTREEIARAFGFRSLNAAEQHLQALAKKGLIELVSGTSRGIRLREALGALQESAREFGLPLIGKVAAGSPILAQENVLRHSAIDPALFKPRADYLLEVRGMSMRDIGILDGDWLAVHRQDRAHNGQVVVARLGDDVTVKRLKLKGARAELIAENPDFEPIVVDLKRDPFEIEGLVVGVIRPAV
ncbi:MAG TPA: transcriptional repressor LexA [Burkholderiaceae bacterium]|nr:transcriptional repressor LexA [Burkholderiaceae bacterium]